MGYLNEDGLATLVGKVKGQVVQLTSAEYRNLPDTKLSDNKTYFVTDEDYAYAIDDEPTLNSDNLVKSGGVYTYTSKIGSGTLTTTAQTIIPAINELDAAIDTLNTGLAGVGVSVSVVDTSHFSLSNANVYRFGNLVVGSVILQCTSDFSNGEMIQFNSITLPNYSFDIGAVSASQWAYDVTKTVRLYFKTNGTVALTSSVTSGQYLTIPVCFRCN